MLKKEQFSNNDCHRSTHDHSHSDSSISLMNKTLLDKHVNKIELELLEESDDDILFQWRIKRKLHEAREAVKINQKYFPMRGSE